ncbi:acyl carrier protein, partial [Mycobacterium marinum]
VLAGCGGQRVGLPTYAFAHERFWLADRFGVGQQVCVGQVLADEAGPGAHEAAGAAVGQGFAARLQGLSDAEQQAAVLAMVCEHTAAVLGRDGAAQLDAGQAFSDAGLTSLSAVELR